MSTRFKQFVARIARRSDFLPIRDQLLHTMKRDAIAKYRNYPRLINKMNQIWENNGYKDDRRNIAGLIEENSADFLIAYLTILFPFRRRGIKIESVKSISSPDPSVSVENQVPISDVVIQISHKYSVKEMEVIQELLKTNDSLNMSAESVCKRLFLYCMNAFGYVVKEIYGTSYSLMTTGIDGGWKEKEYLVTVKVHGRE